MSRVIIFSTGVVRKKLIGPEIRVWEFAKNLSAKGHDVTLAVPNTDFPLRTDFTIIQYTDENIRALTKNNDVAVTQGDIYHKFVRFAERIPTVCDLYDPYVVECLHLDPHSFPAAVETLKAQLLTGDFFLCASEAQRLFYLGMLTILGRLDPHKFSQNNNFENIIALVPFGAAEGNLNFLKSLEAKKGFTIFLGGVYTWYDPYASLDCLKMILEKRRDVRFAFTKFPYDIPAVKTMEKNVLEYAAKIGVTDNITFGEWAPYEERSKLYSDLDIALVIHQPSLEATLSFRTRILDFLSFGIPVITNEGGDLEKFVKDYACGLIVKENNARHLADALLMLIDNQREREQIISRGKRLVNDKFLWHKVIEPLDAFCRNPFVNRISAGRDQEKSLMNEMINHSNISDNGERVTPLYKNDCYYAHLSIYKFASDYIKDKFVLDAGSGAGYGTAYLSSNGARFVFGIDLSTKAIAFSNQQFKNSNLEYRVMDLQNISGFPDHHFGVIFSSNALEHVPDVFLFMRTAWKLLSKDGTMIIAVPPITNKWSRENNEGCQFHLNIWTPRQWAHVLAQFFEEVDVYRHQYTNPNVMLNFSNTPDETRITENDFAFFSESIERFYEIESLTAVFVAQKPKKKIPSHKASVSFVDESYTRTDKETLSIANYAIKPTFGQLCKKGVNFGVDNGLIPLMGKTFHYIKKRLGL